MENVYSIADYFVKLGQDQEDSISNMKLQKLMYYAQGYYMKNNDGKKLFSNNIEAWEHGPVIRDIYTKYSNCGSMPINNVSGCYNELNKEVINYLRAIFDLFGRYSAWALREKTHNEKPWLDSYVRGEKNIIKDELIEEYFKAV